MSSQWPHVGQVFPSLDAFKEVCYQAADRTGVEITLLTSYTFACRLHEDSSPNGKIGTGRRCSFRLRVTPQNEAVRVTHVYLMHDCPSNVRQARVSSGKTAAYTHERLRQHLAANQQYALPVPPVAKRQQDFLQHASPASAGSAVASSPARPIPAGQIDEAPTSSSSTGTVLAVSTDQPQAFPLHYTPAAVLVNASPAVAFTAPAAQTRTPPRPDAKSARLPGSTSLSSLILGARPDFQNAELAAAAAAAAVQALRQVGFEHADDVARFRLFDSSIKAFLLEAADDEHAALANVLSTLTGK